MGDILRLLSLHMCDCFRSRKALEAENTLLRHQLGVLRRKSSNRIRLTRFDRLIFTLLYKFYPQALSAMHIVQPEPVIRWHHMGFKALWRCKSRPRGGRPKTSKEVRDLIHEMSMANHLWGAPRIHAAYLHRVLKAYTKYYNDARTHLSLEKNVPVPRSISASGAINSTPHLGGLQHEYARI